MKTHHNDLTIDEAMADPLIRRVMRADRVEPRQLESMLRTLASVGASPPLHGFHTMAVLGVPPKTMPAMVCGSLCSW